MKLNLHLNQALHHCHYCHYFHPFQITGPDPNVEATHPCPGTEGPSPLLQQIRKKYIHTHQTSNNCNQHHQAVKNLRGQVKKNETIYCTIQATKYTSN
jgi:hypothetical protein